MKKHDFPVNGDKIINNIENKAEIQKKNNPTPENNSNLNNIKKSKKQFNIFKSFKNLFKIDRR